MITDAILFEQSLEYANIDFSPSFCHGLLTAYSCQHKPKVDWSALLVTNFDPHNEHHQETVTTFTPYINDIQDKLGDESFSFQLLVDEESSIRNQVLCFREWVSGYWMGLQNIILPPHAIDDESVEFIKDLQRFVNLALPDEEDQDTLADLIELQEYCRCGVIGLYLGSWQDPKS